LRVEGISEALRHELEAIGAGVNIVEPAFVTSDSVVP
jgi:NAD(P)-dependent dehydrogenase (short-subunit alcohol dehydrogenase family)